MTTPLTVDHGDVIVIGGGLAGVVAALRLVDQGVRPVLLEAGEGDAYPCNSRYAGGVLHLAHHDARGDLREVTALMTSGSAPRDIAKDLICMMVDQAPKVVRWLVSHGGHVERLSDVAWQGTALTPLGLRGSRWSWQGCGTDPTLRALAGKVRRSPASWLSGYKAERVAWNGRGIRGVIATDRDGKHVQVEGARVILADGGFGADRTLVRAHITSHPEEIILRAAKSASGTALRIGSELGAATTMLAPFYGHLLSRDTLGATTLAPYPQLDVLATNGMLIAADGNRVGGEGWSGIRLANELARSDHPSGAVAVFDERIWTTLAAAGPLPTNPTLVELGYTLWTADTVGELARLANLPENAVQHSLTVRNAAVSDTQETASLAAPFYAAPVCPGLTHTMGGLRIDDHCRVLDGSDVPLPGLYAVGGSAGGFEGGTEARYLGGLMKALVTGHRAASHASRFGGRAS